MAIYMCTILEVWTSYVWLMGIIGEMDVDFVASTGENFYNNGLVGIKGNYPKSLKHIAFLSIES